MCSSNCIWSIANSTCCSLYAKSSLEEKKRKVSDGNFEREYAICW